MKIVVDKLPESPDHCLFAELEARSVGYGLWHKCKLSGVSCYSDYGDPCPFLIVAEHKDWDEKEDRIIHSKWVFSGYEGEPWCECLNCGFVPSRKAYKESHKCCSECGAIMDEK